jgi:hypothetical protein
VLRLLWSDQIFNAQHIDASMPATNATGSLTNAWLERQHGNGGRHCGAESQSFHEDLRLLFD